MRCVICEKNEAVIHYAEVVDGQIKKLDLCEHCAAKKGLGTQLSFSMGDLLGGMADKVFPAEKKLTSCNECNMSLEEFRKCGRLGCPNCYDVFKNTLEPMIEQIHRSKKHKGKFPAKFQGDHFQLENIQTMEKELKDAIKTEDFEKAAFLRDEILKEKQKLV